MAGAGYFVPLPKTFRARVYEINDLLIHAGSEHSILERENLLLVLFAIDSRRSLEADSALRGVVLQ